LFVVLLAARSKIKLPGGLFCLYLVFNGMERFAIEKIRVNTKYEGLPFQPTQAELISLGLVVLGVVLYFVCRKKAAVS
jgi:prolipoprotein diacylglyceryltransferase